MFELLVSIMLVGLVMVGINAMLRAGIRYYRFTSFTLEAQQNVLVGLNKMATEIQEGSELSLRVDRDAPGGVIFGSPRNASGGITYQGTQIEWGKLVCYYVETIDGVPCLVRKAKLITPTLGPPVIPSEETTLAFQSDTSLTRTVVARHVLALDVTDSYPLVVALTAGDPTGEFKVQADTKVDMRN